MTGKVLVVAMLAVAMSAASAFAVNGVMGGLMAPSQAQASEVTKSTGGGEGGESNVGGAGHRLGELLNKNGVPVLIAFAGILLIGALASRNIGASLGIVLITLVGLMFLLAPNAIQGFAKGVANIVF